jgi:hypothetical protein
MIDLTPEARTRFDQYLERMHRALRGSRAVEASEVEQNVREHVEIALGGASAPIGADRLDEVLAQLGPPDRWLSEDERPWWRRALQRISDGPEDWRVAYVAFGAFALGLLLLPIGFGLVFLICAFFLSRAEIELLATRDEALGARRWLVLPAIWAMLLGVSLLALVVPVGLMGGVAIGEGALYKLTDLPSDMRTNVGFIALSAGVWWLILSGIFAAVVRPYRAFFLPASEHLSRKHAAVLALIGLMIGAIGGVLLFV